MIFRYPDICSTSDIPKQVCILIECHDFKSTLILPVSDSYALLFYSSYKVDLTRIIDK